MAEILCIDSSAKTIRSLTAAGHTVHVGTVGVTNGTPNLQNAPHEVDLIVCDLVAPACFDSLSWGPGGNDNYHATIVPTPKEEYYRRDGDLHPRYKIIQPGQMAKLARHTFGPKDVLTAVEKGGVPAVLFLNQEWVQHVDYSAPNIFGVSWRFNPTNAKRVEFAPELRDLIGDALVGCVTTPIKFAVSLGAFRAEGYSGTPSLCPHKPLVTNAIGDVFGQRVLLDRGSMWILPAFSNNADVVLRLLEHLPRLREGLKADVARPASVPVSDGERDIFISHASEDKDSIARPLAKKLIEQGVSVWFDEYELTLGDRLREKIDNGLRASRFGLTILSHAFFAKSWPQSELDGLLSLERGSKRILPVWHNLTVEEIKTYSPILSGRLGISTDKGIDQVVDAIQRAIGR
jgi:hypothetical protein